MAQKSKQLDDQAAKQRTVKEAAITNLINAIKLETKGLNEQLEECHSASLVKVKFEDKMSSKLSWRGFKGFPNQKEDLSKFTVWPTDQQFVELPDSVMMELELTHIHFKQGNYVESLTMEVNNKNISIMNHPPGNNFVQKLPKEVKGSSIRRIEATVNKKKSMISSIAFLDDNGDKICDIQGSQPSQEKYTIELGPNEVIVGCRQFNSASLRDIEFRVLDRSKVEGWVADETTDISFNVSSMSGVKISSLE